MLVPLPSDTDPVTEEVQVRMLREASIARRTSLALGVADLLERAQQAVREGA